ncbi:MAG: hypothetical protein AAF226_19655, partial [Verrucomicrobiota bacterium]
MAHKVSSVSAVLSVDTQEQRSFELTAEMEVESSGDDVTDDEIPPETAAQNFARENLVVIVDEQDVPFEISTEMVNTSYPDTPEELQRIVVYVTIKGEIPDGGESFSLYLEETAGMSIVVVTVKNGVQQRRMSVMLPGEYSRSVNVARLEETDPFEKETASSAAESKIIPISLPRSAQSASSDKV